MLARHIVRKTTPMTRRTPGSTSGDGGIAEPACAPRGDAGMPGRRRGRMKLIDEESGEVVSQLSELARRFPPQFVEQKDGQDYVAHHVVGQRLLSVVGPFDFQLVEILRSDVPAVPPDPAARSQRGKRGTPAVQQVVTGAVWRLTCKVDGRRTQVEEVGNTDPHNWATDGARLKDAASDALKRAAMRLGLGLHLWAQSHYFLDKQLAPPPAPKRLDPEPDRRRQDEHQAMMNRARERGSPIPDLVDPPSPAWAKDGAR